MKRVQLSRGHYDDLCKLAERQSPEECCGLLIGQGDDEITISKVVVSDNLADRPDRFLIDPQLQFDWMRRLRGQAQRIVGHFHSHPNGAAEPSQTDCEMALDTDLVWLIIPVTGGMATAIQAYKVDQPGVRFAPIDLRVLDRESPAAGLD